MFKRKKEKAKIKYFSMRDILNSIKINRNLNIKEKSFDWQEISVKGIINKYRIIKNCKRYGKIKRVPQGFIIKFNY